MSEIKDYLKTIHSISGKAKYKRISLSPLRYGSYKYSSRVAQTQNDQSISQEHFYASSVAAAAAAVFCMFYVHHHAVNPI